MALLTDCEREVLLKTIESYEREMKRSGSLVDRNGSFIDMLRNTLLWDDQSYDLLLEFRFDDLNFDPRAMLEMLADG